eukprot:SAG11_NODE_37806_length_255_cov_0.660256_1_plen_40_part_01
MEKSYVDFCEIHGEILAQYQVRQTCFTAAADQPASDMFSG